MAGLYWLVAAAGVAWFLPPLVRFLRRRQLSDRVSRATLRGLSEPYGRRTRLREKALKAKSS
jgi:hypothetical protein